MSIWTDEQGRLHAAVMAKGKRIHRRLPQGASQSDAKRLEAELLLSLERRQPAIPHDPPMSTVMDSYLAHAKTLRSPKTAEYHALRTGPWLEGKRASQATEAARMMIRDMRGHYAPATINRSLGAIKTALTIAYRQGLTAVDFGDKIKRLPENNARQEYLSIAQVHKLAGHASEQTRAAIWIALLTGARRGEILQLTQADIEGKTLRIRAGNTKTLRERRIPIVPAVRPWLKYVPLQINAEGLKTGFRRAREAAGMPQIHYHDLRHSCASLLINLGTPLEVVRDILGHTTVKTTERYAHLQIDRQREALSALSIKVRNHVK